VIRRAHVAEAVAHGDGFAAAGFLEAQAPAVLLHAQREFSAGEQDAVGIFGDRDVGRLQLVVEIEFRRAALQRSVVVRLHANNVAHRRRDAQLKDGPLKPILPLVPAPLDAGEVQAVGLDAIRDQATHERRLYAFDPTPGPFGKLHLQDPSLVQPARPRRSRTSR
jgi:hypothetical protein